MSGVKRKDLLTYSIMLLLGLLFYLLPGTWISLERDSVAYLSPEGREGVLAGYPMFLSFFKGLLGEQNFLHGVVIAQSLLAVVCTFLFVLILKKQFQLKGWESILLYLFCMLPFSIYLPEVGITHQIMTEGISYSIFYLFFIAVIKTIWSLEYKWYFGSLAFAALLTGIRSQMLFLAAVCLLLFLWLVFRKYGGKLLCKLTAGAIVFLTGLILIFGSKIQSLPSQLNTVIMARGFYEADEEDVNLFDDSMMREIFTRTYQLADEEGRRYVYARPGLYMWQDIVHDRMNIYALQAIREYDEKHPDERTKEEASVFFELGTKVLFKHFDRYLYHSIRLMMPSFIATVFFQIQPIYLLCHFIALFIYLFSIVGSIMAGKMGGDRNVVELSAAITGILIIMAVTVNLLFIGLQRYMVYGMGIFYCAMYLLCREMVWCFWEKSGKEWRLLKALIGERSERI